MSYTITGANDLRRDYVALLLKKREIEIKALDSPAYTDENWDILAEVIRTTTSLEKLEFLRWACTALKNDKVIEALTKNRSIISLSLWYASVGDEGAKAVAAILKENSTIESVHLGYNGIGVEGAKAIADALKVNKTLRSIKLFGNHIGVEVANAIAEALKENTNIQTLSLWLNQIGDEGGKAIADALKQNDSLHELRIGGNNIGDQGAKVIAEALKENTSLQKLFLGSNIIGVQGAKAIADALKHNKALRHINLSSNNIGVDGAKAIADALKHNKTVRYIDLTNNRIDAEGAKAIADALKDNTSLTTISLYENDIGIGGGKSIADALKLNKTLKHIDLGCNKIGVEGGKAIADALKVNPSLQELNIGGNFIYEKGGKHILKALQQIERSAIEKISLYGNYISDDTFGKIQQEVARIKKRFKSAGSNEEQIVANATAVGESRGVQNETSSSNEDEGLIHTTNAPQGSAENVQETNGKGHNTKTEAEVEELKSTITQLQGKIAEQDKEIASMKNILKTIGNLANGKDGGATSNTESSMSDRKTELQLQSEIERYKQENNSLKEQLKNSRPIETVDLTNEIEPATSSGDDSTEEEPPSKRRCMKSNLAVAFEQTQQLVEVKEEAKKRAAAAEANVAVARREKSAVEASLRDVQEDLEDSNELVTQQTLTTDIWQGRFDELCELARAAGVDGNTLSEIRYRPLSSGR